MTSTPREWEVTSPQYRERGCGAERWRASSEQNWAFQGPVLPDKRSLQGIPPAQATFQEPGILLPPSISMAEPQAQPVSWTLSSCHTLVCQLFLWLQFKDFMECLSSALSLHPLPGGGTRDSGGDGLEGLSPGGHSVPVCTCMLTKTPGAGLGKRNRAKEAESRFRKRTKSRTLGALGAG